VTALPKNDTGRALLIQYHFLPLHHFDNEIELPADVWKEEQIPEEPDEFAF
jgi:hypothetical protein